MGDGRVTRNTEMLLVLGPPPNSPRWLRHAIITVWNDDAIEWLIERGYANNRPRTTWFIDDFYSWYEDERMKGCLR